jgi:hypothetical protein
MTVLQTMSRPIAAATAVPLDLGAGNCAAGTGSIAISMAPGTGARPQPTTVEQWHRQATTGRRCMGRAASALRAIFGLSRLLGGLRPCFVSWFCDVHFVEEAVRRIVILVSILDVLVQKAGLRRAEVEKTQSI